MNDYFEMLAADLRQKISLVITLEFTNETDAHVFV